MVNTCSVYLNNKSKTSFDFTLNNFLSNTFNVNNYSNIFGIYFSTNFISYLLFNVTYYTETP